MKIDLSGRTALVTGSTAGIGAAVAERLAASGAEVIVNGRNAERVAATASRIGARGVVADVSTAAGARDLIAQVPQADILINNAGAFVAKPIFELEDEDWRDIFETNVLSGIRLAKHYAPRMAQLGWGRIIFISSEAGVQPPTNMVHYGMSKTAQLAVSRGLAQQLAGSGVTANSVLAGPTITEGVLAMWEDIYSGLSREEQEARFIAEGRAAGSLLHRLIRPEEIANMVTYLASEFASATTGRALGVDGGLVPTVLP